MPIQLTCVCGKKLTVPDDAAGRRARCPECNAVVPVPGVAPEPPPPPPEERTATGRVDQAMDTFIEDLAKSRERAPELTQIATGLLIWSGVALILSLLASMFADEGRIILWLLIDVPMCAVGAAVGLATIKGWPRTPEMVNLLMPGMLGASYVLFWQATMIVIGWSFLHFVTAVVWLGGSGFLYWYFRWHGAAKLFDANADEPAADDPSKGKTAS